VWKLIEQWAEFCPRRAPAHPRRGGRIRISISDRINQVIDTLEAGAGSVRFDDIVGHDLAEASVSPQCWWSLCWRSSS